MALTDPAARPDHLTDSRTPAVFAASAVLICLNEAACIAKCLESLRGFAEIVVVDLGSTDGTLAIVDDFALRGFPVRLIRQPWLGYARQKQLALDLATCPGRSASTPTNGSTRICAPRCLISWRLASKSPAGRCAVR